MFCEFLNTEFEMAGRAFAGRRHPQRGVCERGKEGGRGKAKGRRLRAWRL